MTPSLTIAQILDTALVAIIVEGRSGTITHATGGCLKLLGWAGGELEGQNVNVVIPERSREVHDIHRDSYMEAPTPRPMGPDREVFMRRTDGSEVRVWIGLTPMNGYVLATIIPAEGQPHRQQTLNPTH